MQSKSYRKNEDSSGEALLLMLLGGAVGAGLAQPQLQQAQLANSQLIHKNAQLLSFYNKWGKVARIYDDRLLTLKKFSLTTVIQQLDNPAKEAFIEALNCYLLGQDLAASTMICLAIELLLRQKANGNSIPLAELIDSVAKRYNFEPHLQERLHLLRRQRNIQAHTATKLEELVLLGLFKALKEIQMAFAITEPIK